MNKITRNIFHFKSRSTILVLGIAFFTLIVAVGGLVNSRTHNLRVHGETISPEQCRWERVISRPAHQMITKVKVMPQKGLYTVSTDAMGGSNGEDIRVALNPMTMVNYLKTAKEGKAQKPTTSVHHSTISLLQSSTWTAIATVYGVMYALDYKEGSQTMWTGGDIDGYPVVERSDDRGTTWQRSYTFPNAGDIRDIEVINDSDVWAGGHTIYFTPVLLHWNGVSWYQPTIPGLSEHADIWSFRAFASNDVWVVGSQDLGVFYSVPFAAHWDGTSWNLTNLPTGDGGGIATVISGTSSNDLYVAGTIYDYRYQSYYYALHYDGSNWKNYEVPSSSTQASFYSMKVFDTSTIFFVGGEVINSVNGQTIMQLSGGNWTTQFKSSNYSPSDLWTIDGNQSADVWAGGDMITDNLDSFLMHYTCSAGTPTPTPQLTGSPCPINFSDVTPTDYFYGPVMNLACAHIVSGYSDGTFRPANPMTRSQIAKVIVGAFKIPVNPPKITQTFADVQTTDPMFSYVEAVAAQKIMTGYACGGANEPCDSLRRPYFRPGSNVTRGQAAKVVILAAGFGLSNPYTPTFTDVGHDNSFFFYVETAKDHEIISGYADQTFKPNDSVTRGQASKMIYLAMPH